MAHKRRAKNNDEVTAVELLVGDSVGVGEGERTGAPVAIGGVGAKVPGPPEPVKLATIMPNIG